MKDFRKFDKLRHLVERSNMTDENKKERKDYLFELQLLIGAK